MPKPTSRRRSAGGARAYYTELISTGVNDPLKTKAMVVQDGATTFAFVGNDLSSVPRDLTDLARLRASQLTGIPVANIVITATRRTAARRNCITSPNGSPTSGPPKTSHYKTCHEQPPTASTPARRCDTALPPRRIARG